MCKQRYALKIAFVSAQYFNFNQKQLLSMRKQRSALKIAFVFVQCFHFNLKQLLSMRKQRYALKIAFVYAQTALCAKNSLCLCPMFPQKYSAQKQQLSMRKQRYALKIAFVFAQCFHRNIAHRNSKCLCANSAMRLKQLLSMRTNSSS